MSDASALALTVGIVAMETALVMAARRVKRGPFPAIDRALVAARDVIYRWTGAAALDRAIDRSRGRREFALFLGLAQKLDDAGTAHAAERCREAAAQIRAR